MSRRHVRLATRALLAWVRMVARLVPPSERPRWIEEWTSELRHGTEGQRISLARAVDLLVGVVHDGLGVRRDAARTGGGRLGTGAIDAVRRDLGFALRRLRRYPVSGAAITATLALGVGANVAIFALADTVLLKPLPYPEADRLVRIGEAGPQRAAGDVRVSIPDFFDWREQAGVLEDVAAYGRLDLNVLAGDRPVRTEGHAVSANFFGLLGGAPMLGRGFLPEEEDEGRAATVVLGHGFWLQELGGDPGVIGRGLPIEGVSHTIVGVMPRGFRPPEPASLWLPLGTYRGDVRVWRPTHVLDLVGRLRPGIGVAEASSALTELAQGLWERGSLWAGWTVTVRPLRAAMYGDLVRVAGFLWAAGIALLLAMCANLAGLFVVDGLKRRHELGVRSALGADRWRLLGQALVEVGLLATMAVVLGGALARAVLAGLAAALPPAVSAVHALTLGPRAIAYAVLIAFGSSLAFGLLPLARRLRVDGSARGATEQGGAARLRRILVSAQVACSLALLVTTLLVVRSSARLRAVDPGFRSAGAVSFRVALPGLNDGADVERRAFYRGVEAGLARLPGVAAVGMGSMVPFVRSARGSSASIFVVGHAPEPGAEQPIADVGRVSPGLLDALGVAVLRGRGIEPSDDALAPGVALVNRTAAAMLWPDADPLGARIRTGTTQDAELLVVGVTEDVRLSDLARPATPQVFLAAEQFPPASQTFVVRTALPAEALEEPFRRVVAAVDPRQPVFDLTEMTDHVDRSMAGSIVSANVLAGLAALCALLAGVGIHAIVAFVVAARVREFGVRRALGARTGDLVGLLFREGAVVVGAGLVGGAVLAVAAAPVVRHQLYGISPIDLPTYLQAVATLGILALLSGVAPALRAVRIDADRALRS